MGGGRGVGENSPACCECVWMQAPASFILNAFQNNGVQADSLRPLVVGTLRNSRLEPGVGTAAWG